MGESSPWTFGATHANEFPSSGARSTNISDILNYTLD
jgi:hypothetical protein